MKRTLGLLATAALLWVGIELATQAYPMRTHQRGNSSYGVDYYRPSNDYPRGDDSYYYQQRGVIIQRRGGYDNCYHCSIPSQGYNGYYRSPRPYNTAPFYYPDSPYSFYNRYNGYSGYHGSPGPYNNRAPIYSPGSPYRGYNPYNYGY
ncbi:hypothetical protein [Gloeothece verrucosa]|uniref:Uncharacterized protein n=1 Tax=Gloeothece verrucosa (strain PCC 7822) TaxID=497965 RepID=E0UK46_GLOV7|nr:hypothetical protein [Gloeothece verrucosa]ADN14682.1 hypothetical protein Cyan7822_2715 [Gloeothece verrucosa PCC 7822]